MSLLRRVQDPRRGLRGRAGPAARAPPALRAGPDPDDLPSHLVLAAIIRRNISFPAARSFRPGPCKRPNDTTDEFSLRPSSAAASDPQSSAPVGIQPSWEDHPPPKPLPRQIPIDGQLLAAFPRVPSSEAFRRRPPVPGRLLGPGPASATPPDSRPPHVQQRFTCRNRR